MVLSFFSIILTINNESIDWCCMSIRASQNTSILFNSLAPGRFEGNLRRVIFKLILMIGGWDIFCKIVLRSMSMDLTDDKSTLVQVMAWCRQATSHYLYQCWPRSMSPYGITRPQWVNSLFRLTLMKTSKLTLLDLCDGKLPWPHIERAMWKEFPCFGIAMTLTLTSFVRGIHRWPVNSPHKGPVTQKMFPFDDIIMVLALGDFSTTSAASTHWALTDVWKCWGKWFSNANFAKYSWWFSRETGLGIHLCTNSGVGSDLKCHDGHGT